MAGSSKNFDTQTIIVDSVGEIWAGLAVPAANARITLYTDGTPESVANPNAIHLGHTKEGAKITINSSITKHYADEEAAPIKATVEQTEFMIEGNFLQLLDEDVLKKLTAGFGTYGTAAGYKQFQIGRRALVYESIALIFPTPADITKFAVGHIYNAINEGGLGFGVSRKGMAESPFKFVGYGLTSRAASDSLGNYWWQI
jgi:hypothetical protein